MPVLATRPFVTARQGFLARLWFGIKVGLMLAFMGLGWCFIPVLGLIVAPVLWMAALALPPYFLAAPRQTDLLTGHCPYCDSEIQQRGWRHNFRCKYCCHRVMVRGNEFVAVGMAALEVS